MSDTAVVQAMRNIARDDLRAANGRWVGGSRALAQAIGRALTDDPQRLVDLLINLPTDISAAYVEGLLAALDTAEDAPTDLLLTASESAVSRDAATHGAQASRLLERVVRRLSQHQGDAAEVDLDRIEQVVATVLQTSTPRTSSADTDNPVEHGSAQRDTATEGGHAQAVIEALSSAAVNHAVDAPLKTLAALAQFDPSRLPVFLTEASALARSFDIAARATMLSACFGVLLLAPRDILAVAETALTEPGLTATASHAARDLPPDPLLLLASEELRHLLVRGCWSAWDSIRSLLERLNDAAGHADEQHQLADRAHQRAAEVAAIAAARHPGAATLRNGLAQGDVSRRRGVALGLADILPFDVLDDEAVSMLVTAFDDEDSVGDEALRVFWRLPADADEGHLQLLLAGVPGTRAFARDATGVLRAIEEHRGRLPVAAIEIVEHFIDVHGPESSDLSRSVAGVALHASRTVVSVYAQLGQPGGDERLGRKCLDLIDRMILLGSYGLDDALATLDR